MLIIQNIIQNTTFVKHYISIMKQHVQALHDMTVGALGVIIIRCRHYLQVMSCHETKTVNKSGNQ